MPSDAPPRKRKALIADPSSNIRTSVWMILKDEYTVLTANSFPEAVEIAEREELEIVLAGIDLPPVFYEAYFQSLRKSRPRLPLLLLLGEKAIGGKKLNLPWSDFLPKPFSVQALREKVQNLILEKDLAEKKNEPKLPVPAEEKIKAWLYSSRMPADVREKVFKVSFSSFPVFIQGEEGTGKSEVAKAIHFLSPNKDRPFLRFFCRGLTAEKFAQKLTFWLKNFYKGESIALTLFFEEVENLDWDMQTILLDLWHDQRINWPGLEEIGIEAKIISTSISSLAQAVSAGKFRGDLYQTLEMLPIFLKPLRERKEEIPRLANEILQEHNRELISRKKFSLEALEILQQYYWPGNLSELESLTLRSAVLKEGDILLPEDLIFSFGRLEAEAVPRTEVKKEKIYPAISMAPEEKGNLFDATLSTLAHEIKNPLVAISTFASLLPEKYDDPEFRYQFSKIVNLDVQRINELLENLLEFAQLPSPRIQENFLNQVIREVLRRKEKFFKERGTELILELKDDLPNVLFDGAQLDFVLRNVLDNICKQEAGPNKLKVSTDLKEEDQKRFVELHFWYDTINNIRKMAKAFGEDSGVNFEELNLALSLARKVMVRNRGDMAVSQEEGKGTILSLKFQVAS